VAGATYFITFRCNAQFQLEPQASDLVMIVIQEQDRKTIDLDAAVVMPHHVHAIFRVIEPYTLSRVLQRIKGRSLRQINLLLSRRGRLFSLLMRSVVGRPGRLSFPRGCREESRVFARPFRDSARAPDTRAGMTEGPYSAFLSGGRRASTRSSGMGRSWKINSNTFVRIRPNRGWKIARAIISGSSREKSQAKAFAH
jgi:REP element-mobilizing transposase RayT